MTSRAPCLVLAALLLGSVASAGCLEAWLAHDTDFCEHDGDDLVLQMQQLNGSYDAQHGWVDGGPVVTGVLFCSVEDRPVQDFGFRVRHGELGTFVFHPNASGLGPDGQPSVQFVQTSDDAGSAWQGADHVPHEPSVSLALGHWANEGPLPPPAPGVGKGYPSRDARFGIGFDSDDNGAEPDAFPQGHLLLDVWFRSEPDRMIRFVFPVDAEGRIGRAWSETYPDAPTEVDPRSGRPIPVLWP